MDKWCEFGYAEEWLRELVKVLTAQPPWPYLPIDRTVP